MTGLRSRPFCVEESEHPMNKHLDNIVSFFGNQLYSVSSLKPQWPGHSDVTRSQRGHLISDGC